MHSLSFGTQCEIVNLVSDVPIRKVQNILSQISHTIQSTWLLQMPKKVHKHTMVTWCVCKTGVWSLEREDSHLAAFLLDSLLLELKNERTNRKESGRVRGKTLSIHDLWTTGHKNIQRGAWLSQCSSFNANDLTADTNKHFYRRCNKSVKGDFVRRSEPVETVVKSPHDF